MAFELIHAPCVLSLEVCQFAIGELLLAVFSWDGAFHLWFLACRRRAGGLVNAFYPCLLYAAVGSD